eukprot:Platyproteum_vivax@DN6775_c0_g1_i1.p1
MICFYPLDTCAKRLMHDRHQIERRSFSKRMAQASQAVLRDAKGKSLVSTVKSLYAGFFIAAAYKISQRSFQFGGQPYFKDFLHTGGLQDTMLKNYGPVWGKVWLSATAGALIGVGEIIFVPINLLKIKCQTEPSAMGGKTALQNLCSHSVPELFRGGLWATTRNVPGAFALFGTAELSKQFVFKNHKDSVFEHFASAFCGAIASLLVSSPFDVVKTRLQGSQWGTHESGISVIKHLLREEGWTCFFKGMTPKILTIGPKLAFSFGLAQLIVEKLGGSV